MNNVKCESYQGAAVYGEFNSKNETEESSSKKRFKGIVTAYDTHSGSGNDDCSLILTVEEADDSLLDWIQFTKAPVTTQRPKKRKRKPKATTTPHWAKTTTTSTTTSTTSTSSTTRSTTLTTITTSTKHLTTSTSAQSTTKPNEATTVSNPTSVGKSHSETTTYMETTASLKSEMEWLETSTQQSDLFINNPSTKQNQVYELGECADVSQQVEIDDLVSVDCRVAECFFSCPMNRSPNIPYLICNNETNEWILPEFAEKVFCRMLDPEISLIDFLVKERPIFCKETPKALTPNEVQEFCNPYFCIISCADEERTIFCNDGLWPENEFNC
ncbi:Oidioi.mRNA.OKI2018_I69.XSR.g14610.t1.cds [Oikopleura dioica]|uniref:Oidioi.mRNA.OKI2018_I69.XSR.g14610.t1.cds n=1 Tax=Oikopleura dioica TaxID=34765 RepID=A0ABN7SAU3_OIKDI|nr:Oidioi.mRNA.OKI2018_I69.XSR.g14610.t1.cds [Oikopleura dioica]